jgi:hypothetical protein
LLLAGLAGTLNAAPRSYTVQQLSEMKNLPQGIDVQIEGRFQGGGRTGTGLTEFKLQRCEIAFRMDRALPEQPKGKSFVVTGKLSQDRGKSICEVQTLRETQGDIDQFRERKRGLKRDEAKAWYELAEWAKRRGEFYTDVELLSASNEAFRDGLDVERRVLAANDFEGRFRLAAKARESKLADETVMPLVHEAYRIRWKQVQQAKPVEWERLAKDVSRDLPGSDEPLSSPETELRKRYEVLPAETYSSTTPGIRRKLHRMFYSEILLRSVLSRLAADFGNGFEIADEIDKLLPEFRPQGEQYRDKALAAKAAEVNRLSRAQVVDVAKQYRDRKQPQQAEQLLTAWLTLRRKRLDADDIEGHLHLADEYLALLNRADLTEKLLFETAAKHPDSKAISERLEKLGYRKKEGRWLSTKEFQAQPEAEIERAMREGRVALGMTADQVRKSLGQPASRSRAASAGEVSEVWNYGTPGNSRLSVSLVRRRNQAEPVVVQVSQ